jgi:hypothetical protein
MEPTIKLVSLTLPQFAAFVGLFLPGFVSLKIDRLIHPGKAPGAAEAVVETLGYSLLNAGVFGWLVVLVSNDLLDRPNYLLLAVAAFLICLAGPACWPLLFRRLQVLGARKGWVVGPHRFAWDHVFARRQYGFMIVHLTDGSHIGGYFGERSYATVEPESGHLYIEELWTLDAEGRFIARLPDTRGAVFRPADYKWVEFFEDDDDEV